MFHEDTWIQLPFQPLSWFPGLWSAAPGVSCSGWVVGFLLLWSYRRWPITLTHWPGQLATLACCSGEGMVPGDGGCRLALLFQVSGGCQDGGDIKSQPPTKRSLGDTERAGMLAAENTGRNGGGPCPLPISPLGLSVVVSWSQRPRATCRPPLQAPGPGPFTAVTSLGASAWPPHQGPHQALWVCPVCRGPGLSDVIRARGTPH